MFGNATISPTLKIMSTGIDTPLHSDQEPVHCKAEVVCWNLSDGLVDLVLQLFHCGECLAFCWSLQSLKQPKVRQGDVRAVGGCTRVWVPVRARKFWTSLE